MPYWNKQRGKWIGQVTINGVKITSQHGSEAAARRWESAARKELELGQTAEMPAEIRIPSLLEWATMYLDHAQGKFVGKTYSEKRLAFRLLLRSFAPGNRSLKPAQRADSCAFLPAGGGPLRPCGEQRPEKSRRRMELGR